MITFPAIIRTLGAATGIAISIATVVSVPLAVWLAAWTWLYPWLGGAFPTVPNVEIFGVLSEYPPLSWSGDRIPWPPSPYWVLEKTGQAMGLLIGFLALIHLVTPIRAKVRSICGYMPTKADADSPLQLYLNQMARKHQLKRGIRLWTIPIDGVAAFVLTSPLRGHHIVLSRGLVNNAPSRIIHWVLAHEVGHVVHGDTTSGTLWMLTMRSIYLFDRIKRLALVAALHTVFALPMFRFIFWPLYLLGSILMTIGRIGARIGTTVFILFDHWASRHMEYRADAFAARFVGVEPGVKLFTILDGAFEPNFRLFATHPTPKARIDALVRRSESCMNVDKASPSKTASSSGK